MLLWARRNKFSLAKVTVGAVSVEVGADLGIQPGRPPERSEREAGRNLLAEFGGEALKQVLQEADDPNATYIDDDEPDAPAGRA